MEFFFNLSAISEPNRKRFGTLKQPNTRRIKHQILDSCRSLKPEYQKSKFKKLPMFNKRYHLRRLNIVGWGTIPARIVSPLTTIRAQLNSARAHHRQPNGTQKCNHITYFSPVYNLIQFPVKLICASLSGQWNLKQSYEHMEWTFTQNNLEKI